MEDNTTCFYYEIKDTFQFREEFNITGHYPTATPSSNQNKVAQ